MELIDIPGVGPKIIDELRKLNINSINDIIQHYPFRYEIIKRADLEKDNLDNKIYIDGIVETVPSLFRFGSKKSRLSFKLNTKDKLIMVFIFNQTFLKNKLVPGTLITVAGKYDKKKNSIIASEVRFEGISEKVKVEGVYFRTKNLSSKKIHLLINKVLEKDFKIGDNIPDYLKEKYHFVSKKEAILEIHNPTDLKKLEICSKRLKYEELFMFMLKVAYLKQKNSYSKEDNSKYFNDVDIDDFISKLPFTLTPDQLQASSEILADLKSVKRMNRLLQGDVGSGKTIVGFIAVYANYLAGYQSALMVPTEVLAIQHFKNAIKIFENYDLRIELLTSSTPKKKKEAIYQKLERKEIDLVIGTHALIQEDIYYSNLGLVITDEQQRFGVNQRASLRNKGKKVEVLYMSATPIPRTYALTIYGDMDVSSIKSKPGHRKEIITYRKTNRDINDVLNLMKNELDNNHQIFVITPLIEEGIRDNVTNVNLMYDNMVKAFGKKYNVGALHGKLKPNEKNNLMTNFSLGEIDILVSTTVVEVGVDVPNASMIVIFDADNFGLSTIHQLRGRVGRNDIQSYCVLVSENPCPRLKILEDTNDGFEISEYDFKTRKEGDLFGTRQHGDMEFYLADVKKDYKMLLVAKDDANEFLECVLNEKNNQHLKILEDLEKVNSID